MKGKIVLQRLVPSFPIENGSDGNKEKDIDRKRSSRFLEHNTEAEYHKMVFCSERQPGQFESLEQVEAKCALMNASHEI